MARKKEKEVIEKDAVLENQDFDLFSALAALDRKDYDYYDKLTDEQQKKFMPFMLIHWLSAVKGNKNLQLYYLQSADVHANKYLLDYMIASKEHYHPKLQWLMLCAASPGVGKQFHQWIPKISEKISLLKEPAKIKDIQTYFKKLYPAVSAGDLAEISKAFVEEQNKKMSLAAKFPALKFDEIELLGKLISDDEIRKYERDSGN